MVLGQSQAREFVLSFDEVDSHVSLEHLLEGIVENGEILHDISAGKELLGLLGVLHLDKDLELLLLAEELHLNLGLGAFLRAAGDTLWDQSLDTTLYRVDLHFVFVVRLYVQFEDVRSRLLIDDP